MPDVRGFTLLECAIVVLILAVLVTGAVVPLGAAIEARDRHATIAALDDVLAALYGYAVTHGRLPCPDVNGDGLPDPRYDADIPLTAACTDAGLMGFVPWRELGVAAADAWGNRLRYRVRSLQFTRAETDGICDGDDYDAARPDYPEFDLCATSDLSVYGRGDDPASTDAVEGKFPMLVADAVPAVVLSTGRNGHGAVSVHARPHPVAPPATDERENTDNDTEFFARRYSGARADCADDANERRALCAFDDIVRWLSPAVLNHRMVAAGRLP